MKAIERLIPGWVAAVAILLTAAPALAQNTAAIVGTVTDQTQGVLPGVTVTVTGPALMSARTEVTGPDGKYRISTLPPGSDYVVVFELAGFAGVKREGLRLDVGFTATINSVMNPASVSESVTVSGESPVVDTVASTVTTHLNATELMKTLVGSRDFAAVMAQVPGVLNTKMDVGGGNATTMQAFRAYGLSGGRGEIEGINSTQFGSGGLVAYSDTESFDDMAVNVLGNGADMAVPGPLVNVVSKSGGNAYHGQTYIDFQKQGMGTTNIDSALVARGLVGGGSVNVYDLNKIRTFRDFSVNTGGFIVKDKLWWFGAFRHTLFERADPLIIDDFASTEIPAGTVKVTYNVTPSNKFTAYGTLSDKIFKNYGVSTRIVTADALIDERYPIGVLSLGYESLIGRSMVLQIRGGKWGDYGDYKGKGQNQRYDDAGTNRLIGTIPTRIDSRDRPQINGSLSYYKSDLAGSHSFKFGGEFQHEQQKFSTVNYNNLILYLNNNAPTFVEVYQTPNRTRAVSRNAGAYASDSWRLNSRLTFNVGVRFDRYTNYVPPQTGPTGHQFAQVDGPIWNNFGPRLGFVYALTSDNRTVLKANYGKYWENPSFTLASTFNPNPSNYFTRYNWIDPNPIYNAQGYPIYEGPQQLGSVVSSTGARADFTPSITADPNLQNNFTHSSSIYIEREVAANFGLRGGFVWNGNRQGRSTVNINQPFAAFNQPVTAANPGPDGKVGTADDGPSMQAYNLDPSYIGLPTVQVVKNGLLRDSDWYTWEVTATKRQSAHWSLLASFSEMWSYEGVNALSPNDLINTTNGRDAFKEWQVRLSSTLILPKGVQLTPMLRHQAGRPYAPTFTTKLNYSSGVTIKAAEKGDQRLENISIVDIRAEKIFTFGRYKVRGFFDVYNMFNTNAVQDMTVSYGSNYTRPSLISGPRTSRVGVRFEF